MNETVRNFHEAGEPAHAAPEIPLAISAHGLVRHFGAVKAVDGVDLDVPRGMIFAVLGPNGAGKTTLIRMLATLLTPDAGQATVMGHDLLTEPQAVRASIALTGQFASLDEDHTGKLSRSEVRAAFAAQSAQEPEDSRLDNAIAIFDADGDGEIDEQEFEELYEAVMAPSRCAVCNGWTLLLAVLLSAAVFILSSLSCCATDGTDAVQSPLTGHETIDVR